MIYKELSKLNKKTELTLKIGNNWNRHFSKSIYGKESQKEMLNIKSLEKCKLRWQWYIATYLLEWWRCGGIGTLTQCWWECKKLQPVWKTICQFLKVNIHLRNLEIPFLGVYSREKKAYIHTKSKLHMNVHSSLIYNSPKLGTTQISYQQSNE